MTPEAWNAILQLGSAGAVIAVVIIFLKSNEKRDQEWRDFFTSLNEDNKADMQTMAVAMNALIELVRQIARQLTEHDQKVDDRVAAVKRRSRAQTKKEIENE